MTINRNNIKSTQQQRGSGSANAESDHANNTGRAIIKLVQYIRPYRMQLIAASLLAVFAAVLNLIGPGQLSKVTNLITDGLNAGRINLPAIFNICLVLAVIYLAGLAVGNVQAQMITIVIQKLTRDMRRDISRKIDRLPLAFFDSHETGDVLSLTANDVDTVGQSMNQSFSSLVSSLAQLIGAAIMMYVTNAVMATAGILAALVGFAVMLVILPRSQRYFAEQQSELGILNSHIDETFTGFEAVRVNNGEKEAVSAFHEEADRLYDCAWKSQFLSGLMQPLMTFMGNLAYVAVCVVGAVMALQGSISFGTIVAFMIYIRLFTQPLQNISQAASSVQSMAAACERVFDFLDEKEMADESGKTQKITKAKGDVVFRHVNFGYRPERTIIHDFSESVHSGQKIAIVGPTGAGKTTLVNLLMRFYEIDAGQILIDGISTKDVKRSNVHEQFSMVLQDTWLFEGTLRENLVYNQKNISDKDLDRVCEACGLTDLVQHLPDGYDTVLTDDSNLSAGQRQLITIARAMLKDAPLLILDEATSSVDTRTELKVQEAMDKLTQNRTSFVIAHRLSTIRNADCILVMKDGDIIESGTHEELMAKKGFYADLYNSQFEAA